MQNPFILFLPPQALFNYMLLKCILMHFCDHPNKIFAGITVLINFK